MEIPSDQLAAPELTPRRQCRIHRREHGAQHHRHRERAHPSNELLLWRHSHRMADAPATPPQAPVPGDGGGVPHGPNFPPTRRGWHHFAAAVDLLAPQVPRLRP